MPTSFDTSWSALINPGAATQYFNIEYPPFEFQTRGYNHSNALWLAELSRLIYRRQIDEKDKRTPEEPSRHDILSAVGLQETKIVTCQSIHASLLEPLNHNFAILVFRGSSALRDWLFNLNSLPVTWPLGGKVHCGFKQALTRIWPELDRYLSKLTVPVFYTGHSLGASLATLAATLRPPQALYTFGSPRVGNAEFMNLVKSIAAYRIVNHRDMVAKVPPAWATGFGHLGELYHIVGESQLLVKPQQETLADNLESRAVLPSSGNRFDLPDFLTDHAPVNYVAWLERLLLRAFPS